MVYIYFFYGLSFFAMGLAVALESRRASLLALGHHLRWLGAFGLVHSLVEWSDMFQQVTSSGDLYEVLAAAHSILLPFSALLLVRFGIGLVGEAGPLPAWLELVPPVLLVPGTLLVAFAIVVSLTAAHIETAIDIWSRYLLYLPGNVLAAVGFARQWRSLRRSGPSQAQHLLLGAALAFCLNALAAGLIVPQAPYGLAPWLNYDFVTSLTGAPVQVWRMVSAIAITGCVVGALGVFEAERHQQIERLQAERAQAQQSALKAQSDARQHAETWIDGLVAINRQVANLDKIDDLLGAIIGLARPLGRNPFQPPGQVLRDS